jgi:hypothetical protein
MSCCCAGVKETNIPWGSWHNYGVNTLCCVQGMRANEYPSDPAAALEAWARARWPAAGQHAFQWSYQVQICSLDCCSLLQQHLLVLSRQFLADIPGVVSSVQLLSMS